MANFDIKNFLQSSYKKENFIEFIYDKFYGFEENSFGYEQDLLNDTEKKHIQKYKFLGNCNLDNDKELGFFEVITKDNTDIENNRVSLNNILKKKASDELLDGAIAIFHNPSNPNVWRLSFIRFSYDENDKQQVTNLKRYTYVLGENIPIKTAYQQLKNLKYPKLDELQESFSVEKISKEFFTKYKELYHQLVNDIKVVNQDKITNEEEQILNNEKTVSFYIKKLLGRVVFLYFVQKKGWLDNDRKFLSNLYYTHTKDNPSIDFYDEIMETLFFNALNTKRDNDKITLRNKEYTIPYLNGGLFESDEFDDKNLTIPNKDFEKIIELFDSYNFTVIEDTPHDSEIAIDPEMLGRVFEDLLEDRKEKGAFYTPREIVHYMCQQSIINYLNNKFNNKEAIKELVLKQTTNHNKFIKDNATNIYNELLKIRVLDPAIGSGAYPMGMLHEIVSVLSAINMTVDIGKLKRKVIENCIYGVDIENSAVEIAKLRFWLSIVVDEDEPTPLPNLSYKIMVGNSLLETINGYDPIETTEEDLFGTNYTINAMQNKFHKFFNARNNDTKQQYKQDIEKSIDLILNKSLKKYEDTRKKQKEEMNLFSNNKKDLENLTQINDDIRIIRTLKNRPTTELFLYKIYFKEVLDDGGFDVVIGNPPYVRQEKIKELKSKKEIQDFKSYCGTADLYIYFFEKGYNLLKPNGVLSFITSNKYTRAKYGKNFRKFVLENTSLKEYIDFNGVKVFESATVDTSILTYQKAKIKDNSFIYCDVDEKYKKGTELNKFIDEKGFGYSQSDLSVDSFSFSTPAELRIKKQIEKIGIPLKEWDIKINYGIKTGFNEAFIIDGKTKDELIKKDSKSAEIIKPLLRGRDIKRYSYKFANLWLINSHNNPTVNISEYPAIKEHLDKYYDKLEKRSDKGATPYNLRNCAYINEFEKEKIIYPETTTTTDVFILDNKGMFLDKTCFMMIGNNLKYITSILDSKILIYYMQHSIRQVGKGYQISKIFAEKLPIPQIPKEQQKPFEILVDYILFAKEQDMKSEASLFESIIDGMVYDLYFEEDMKKSGYYITDAVNRIVKSFDKSSESTIKLYEELKVDKKIAYANTFRRTHSIIQIINGENKDD